MKLQHDSPSRAFTITAYDDTHLTISGRAYRHNIVIDSTGVADFAPRGIAQLNWAEDFAPLWTKEPQVLIIGVAAKAGEIAQALQQQLANYPCQIMGLGAACRTYNLLISEGRVVTAAILFT